MTAIKETHLIFNTHVHECHEITLLAFTYCTDVTVLCWLYQRTNLAVSALSARKLNNPGISVCANF
jgi:hypothetical protein